MSLIKRNYNDRSVQNFRDDFDNLFDNFFTGFPLNIAASSNLTEHAFKPKINIAEDKEAYHLEAELPGVKKEDIIIDYANDIITLKAQKRAVQEDKEKDYHKIESFYGSFARSVHVPNIDQANIKAKFIDGVLKIELPKQQETQQKSQITIQ